MPPSKKYEDEVPLDELADEYDTLDWNVKRDGRFKDYVDEPPETELFYEGDV